MHLGSRQIFQVDFVLSRCSRGSGRSWPFQAICWPGRKGDLLFQWRTCCSCRGFRHYRTAIITKPGIIPRQRIPAIGTKFCHKPSPLMELAREPPARPSLLARYLTLSEIIRQATSPIGLSSSGRRQTSPVENHFNSNNASRSAAVSMTCWLLTISTSFLRPLGLPIITAPTRRFSRKNNLR
jgi:hypothetical protein